MRQVTNGVKAERAKLVLLAPDTEASDTLDGKLDAMLDEARRREVPVLYCLNRRKLGKAVRSSMKQAAVAVYDPDGAYDSFKKILAFVHAPTEDEVGDKKG
jgi:ribosomal protein L7Ae-like RNA K-turn-binding protein